MNPLVIARRAKPDVAISKMVCGLCKSGLPRHCVPRNDILYEILKIGKTL